ncbi:MAG: RNA-binding domain-containing protein [Candidatus Omnitrophota bacterium]
MLRTSREQFERWLESNEDNDLEFKEARNNFDSSRGSLFDYCAAMANDNGGKIILGVREKPRDVVGTLYKNGTHNQLSREIWDRLRIHVDVEEYFYEVKRVLIFHIPRHIVGIRVRSGGKGDKYVYPIRRGESLAEMDDQKTKEILNENHSDFTSLSVEGLEIEDLDEGAIDVFRHKWAEKSRRVDYLSFDDRKILNNAGLITESGVCFAALILIGGERALQRYLSDAEIIFEWRNKPRQTHYDFRKNWRAPFVSIDDEIWATINSRNLRIPFQEGFFQREIWAFDEKSVREAVHNAVMHRDYELKGRSIFIKASPEEFFVESPGGFFPPVTSENCLWEKSWRNRLLAEALEKIGLVERSSQGLDDIFEQAIRDGKGLPDISQNEVHAVRISIPAQVKDKDFILYLERVSNERQISLSFEEIYELERIREGQKVSKSEFKDKFFRLGLIEQVGKGRGSKYILSQRYYETIGKSGKYTRLKGLQRGHIKQLILNHIKQGKPCNVRSLSEGFPEYAAKDFSNILQELKRDGKIYFDGSSKLEGTWKLTKKLQ